MKASSHALVFILILGISACAVQPSPSNSAVPSQAISATPELNTVTPFFPRVATTEASATAALTPTVTQVPMTLSNPAVVVLANNLPGPDDLALAADGSIYITDVADDSIRRLTPDGKLQVILTGLSAPEGLIIISDNSLLIAEQGKNRLVRYNLQTGSVTPFLSLVNKTSNEGVDGIFLDDRPPDAPSIIIPDSPNGTVLRASLDGQTQAIIAGGFARPTGGWVEADGSLLIADENGGTISRIYPDGTVEKLAYFKVPDDVIEDPLGNIFVATLGDNAIHAIPAGAEKSVLLTSGLSSPQGLIFAPDGNLVVTDPGNHRLIKIMIHP